MATQRELITIIDDRLMDLEDQLAEVEHYVHESRSCLQKLREDVERLSDLAYADVEA